MYICTGQGCRLKTIARKNTCYPVCRVWQNLTRSHKISYMYSVVITFSHQTIWEASKMKITKLQCTCTSYQYIKVEDN